MECSNMARIPYIFLRYNRNEIFSAHEASRSHMSTRRIVITGAGRGLGRAMTAKFAELGHTVIGCSRQQEHVESLRKQFGQPHRFDVIDVTDDAAVRRWAKAVLADGGPPDLLLNNAAIVNQNAVLWEVPP